MLKNRLLILLAVAFLASPFSVSAKMYPDGTLIRVKGDPKVYLIKSHKKEWIQTPEIFKAKKLSWKKVKIISLKEFDAIEDISGLPVPTSAVKANPSISPAPSPTESSVSTPLTPPPVPAKISSTLPAPDYVRADWLISHTTANYSRIGQKITFKYSKKTADRVENFRLYEKKPGDQYFTKITEFKKMDSTICEDIDIQGDWMMTEAGQCGYWAIQRIVPPGGRGMIAYLPAADYSYGEYSYYVAGVDKDGLETPPSPETKLVFLDTADISSPANNQPASGFFPVFKWSITGGWPIGSVADYLILISDDKNAQNPFWAKILKVPAGQSGQSFIYDGVGLNPDNKYEVYIYGHFRQSEYEPDYISIPSAVPKFWIKAPSRTVSLWNFLRALLFPFSKVRP